MAELLKISELAARAGVVKSTIQHYLREGLLPPPVKRPHRNMAYYSAELVDRIRLIKELQTRRNLPLRRIKALLADEKGTAEIRAYLYSQPPALQTAGDKQLSRDQLIRDSGFTAEHLDKLEGLGFIGSVRKGRKHMYASTDVAIVHALASMSKAGLSKKNGFAFDELTFYVDAMRALIFQEVSVFARVMDKLPRKKIIGLARSGLEGTSSLLLALRRKAFLDLLSDPEALVKTAKSASKPTRGRKKR